MTDLVACFSGLTQDPDAAIAVLVKLFRQPWPGGRDFDENGAPVQDPIDSRKEEAALEWIDRQSKETRAVVLQTPGLLGRIAAKIGDCDDASADAAEKIIRWLDEMTLDQRLQAFSSDGAIAYLTCLYDAQGNTLAERMPGWLEGATHRGICRLLKFRYARWALSDAGVEYVGSRLTLG